MKNSISKEPDLLVIGGGPAGLMSAGHAAALGLKVVLLEKNDSLGKKLLLTGHGRGNFTHAGLSDRQLASAFGSAGKFLLSGLSRFNASAARDFFKQLGVKSVVDDRGRVFPESNRAQDLLQALKKFAEIQGVKIIYRAAVSEIICRNSQISELKLGDQKLSAQNYLLATGGQSYRQTGSTGEAWRWLEKLGHHMIAPRPGLVPLVIKEKWVKELAGISLSQVGVALKKSGKFLAVQQTGEIIFTHFGLSGPLIVNLSREVGDRLAAGALPVNLFLDLLPSFSVAKLEQIFQASAEPQLNLPARLLKQVKKLAGLKADQKLIQLPIAQRKKMVILLKELPLTITSLLDLDLAMITRGGVDLKEVDPRTMRSKIIKNLFFAGEILDLDAITGGYNLQECWTTGYVAAQGIKIASKEADK